MRRKGKPKPVTWVHQILESTAIAKVGGPVRRGLPSILNNLSPKIVIDEARRRGWHIIAIGDNWLFYSDTLRQRQVLGRSTTPKPYKRHRRSAKHKRRSHPSSLRPSTDHPSRGCKRPLCDHNDTARET